MSFAAMNRNFKTMAVAPSTPSCPKPQMQRPTLLRSRVEGCKSKSETLTVPFPKLFKPEIDTNLLAFELIQDALTEDAKDAGDDLFYESADDCLNEIDEMDDDVLSLCGQSESEEEEGNLVDLAYDFAKNVVGQGIALDFTKVIQNAVHENIASSDFLEVDDFDDEVTEELGGMEPGHFVFEQDGADPVETAKAQEQSLFFLLQKLRSGSPKIRYTKVYCKTSIIYTVVERPLGELLFLRVFFFFYGTVTPGASRWTPKHSRQCKTDPAACCSRWKSFWGFEGH